MKVIGVVLAGGQSRRMGRDKALLPADGHASLLHRQVALLQSLSLQQVWISRHQSLKTSPDLQPLLVDDHNTSQHLGPLAGIQSIAAHCPDADAVIALPVDLPLIDKATLSQLINTGVQQRQAVYFLQDYLPLFTPLNDELRQYLDQHLTMPTADKSVRKLLNFCNALSLQPADASRLTNTNTQDEWEAIRRPHP
ncbi:molybdenum cofactor guanylyltransferase [Oceanobacter mangrovi]|uniref:molybdenum cofactor guanylyltransferase n=1 Tax=Oceanobacter mangrovi TaxID=2862510 RepID=UPI001C8D71F3|nr:molybdenum cofactor guanylyltransferase [Oceanobacter mangrovi]